jgi:hypothetical protein
MMLYGKLDMNKYRIRFQDPIMQRHYENLMKNGYHWKTAESKTLKTFKEYDNESYSMF